MAISTNSVIHYTDRIECLKGIISDGGFRIKYCLEEIDILSPNPLKAAFPMVSFCDIPLSEIKNHIDAYGSYGIGLTKNWAKQTGLNPVLYIERKSRLSSNLLKQLNRIHLSNKNGNPDNELAFEFFDQISYCKNYEGRLVRGKINSDSYRFYDEREWRFIAFRSDINNEDPVLKHEIYLKNKLVINEKLKDCFVKFSYNDISYIIVDHEDEIPEMLKILNDVFEDIATSKELKILSTKILTKNQIWNDF